VVIALVAVFGLFIGSFLTVVVDRVPRGASVVAPGSACGACGTRLGPLDLVPVLSWLFLRGRCRHCRTSIGTEPLILEIGTAAVYAYLAWLYGWGITLVAHLVLGGALVALSWIDLRIRRLPREITYTAIAIGAPLLAAAALAEEEPERIWMMALGALIAVALLGLIYVASRGGMGDGDVRLSPLLGLYLGWHNPGLVPIMLFLAALAGSVVGVALMVARRAGRRSAVPFGPFLALGTLAALWIGQDVIDIVMAR
jgi:leader peptidase (prepilin peptidase)/N-methyltransferase